MHFRFVIVAESVSDTFNANFFKEQTLKPQGLSVCSLKKLALKSLIQLYLVIMVQHS